MRKRLISILSLIILLQFSVFALKSHKTHKSHGGRGGHKTHRTHKIHDNRPIVTLEEVNGTENVWGIDVSHYQNDINWVELGQQKPNFMFIKASEGIANQDAKYLQNYSEAKKIGILVGSYHFFSYKSSGKDQANNFLSVAQHKTGDLLPVLDAEFGKKMPEKTVVTAELISFVNAIYEKLGHYPIIYCNYLFYKLYLQEQIPDKCKLWIVDYKDKPSCEWAFWQKTNKFKLAGIRGLVDLNMFNGTTINLQNFLYKSPTD